MNTEHHSGDENAPGPTGVPESGKNNTPQEKIESDNRAADRLCSEMMDIVHKAIDKGETIDDFYDLFIQMELEDFQESKNPLALKVRTVFDKYADDEALSVMFRETYREFQLQLKKEYKTGMGIRHKLKELLDKLIH